MTDIQETRRPARKAAGDAMNKIKFIREWEQASESSGLFRTVAAQIDAELASEKLDQEEAATAEDLNPKDEDEHSENSSEYVDDDQSAYESSFIDDGSSDDDDNDDNQDTCKDTWSSQTGDVEWRQRKRSRVMSTTTSSSDRSCDSDDCNSDEIHDDEDNENDDEDDDEDNNHDPQDDEDEGEDQGHELQDKDISMSVVELPESQAIFDTDMFWTDVDCPNTGPSNYSWDAILDNPDVCGSS